MPTEPTSPKATRKQLIKALRIERRDRLRMEAERNRLYGRVVELEGQIDGSAYRADVRETTDKIIAAWRRGDYAEDGAGQQAIRHTANTRFMFTNDAQAALAASDNSGALASGAGTDSLVDSGVLNWSWMAEAAFVEDINDALTDRGIDLADKPCPRCGEPLDFSVVCSQCDHDTSQT